jgi:hypothetical protein
VSRRKQESIDACLANTADAVMRAVEQGASNDNILNAVLQGFKAGKRPIIYIEGKFEGDPT